MVEPLSSEKMDHRGISRGGRYCTDSDCKCHDPSYARYYDEPEAPVVARPSKPLVDQFHDMLHRDHTGLVAGLNAVLSLVGGYQWARSSRGSYEWDDDRFHAEMGNMLDAVSKAANEALDRYRRGPLQCCVLERAADETNAVAKRPEGVFMHQQGMYWSVNASFVRQKDAQALYDALSPWRPSPSEKAFVHLCAPHGKDWLTCPECAKAAVSEG